MMMMTWRVDGGSGDGVGCGVSMAILFSYARPSPLQGSDNSRRRLQKQSARRLAPSFNRRQPTPSQQTTRTRTARAAVLAQAAGPLAGQPSPSTTRHTPSSTPKPLLSHPAGPLAGRIPRQLAPHPQAAGHQMGPAARATNRFQAAGATDAPPIGLLQGLLLSKALGRPAPPPLQRLGAAVRTAGQQLAPHPLPLPLPCHIRECNTLHSRPD